MKRSPIKRKTPLQNLRVHDYSKCGTFDVLGMIRCPKCRSNLGKKLPTARQLTRKRSKGKPTHYSKPEKRFCTMCAGRAWHADSKHPDLRCAKCNGTGFTEYRRLILSAADWQKMKREMWGS